MLELCDCNFYCMLSDLCKARKQTVYTFDSSFVLLAMVYDAIRP